MCEYEYLEPAFLGGQGKVFFEVGVSFEGSGRVYREGMG